MTSDFQTKLKQVEFITFFQNCMATYNFEDLFAGQRTVLFSLTVLDPMARAYFTNFSNEYENLKQLGIDNVYAISSNNMLGPWANNMSTKMLALPDKNMQFVEALAEHVNLARPVKDAAQFWQYIIILNNGIPEQFWESPIKFKKDLPMSLIKNKRYRFNGLNVDIVKKYLIDNPR